VDDQPLDAQPLDESTDDVGATVPEFAEPSAADDAGDLGDVDPEDDDEDDEDDEDDDGADDDGAEDGDKPAGMTLLEREGDVAADYLEGLLDIADLDGDIDMDVEGERALVSIVGGDLTSLVGRDGVVLEALQELTRLAVLRETGARSRLMLDVDGHRARRRTELTERGSNAAAEAKRTGAPVRLTPMSAFERKVVHDAVAAAGLTSESEGEEPNRFVVVLPT
jgi:spoIIIJ-associated protein